MKKLRLPWIGSVSGTGSGSPRAASPTSSSGGSGSGSGSPLPSVERARSAPNSVRDVPTCPVCQDASGQYVRKFRYWLAQQAWVWHCSAESSGVDSVGAAFCGALFCEHQPRTTCDDCGRRVTLFARTRDAVVDGIDFVYACHVCRKERIK